MLTHLKCYVSTSFEVDLRIVEEILEENNVELYELYDGSIGTSFQDILKRKLRQVDFAIFIISKNNKNILYEIGVCEGLGKQALILIDKEVSEIPFFIENKLSLSANLNDKKVLELAIKAFVSELPAKKAKPEKPRPNRMATESYDEDTKEIFRSLLVQTRNLREFGTGTGVEMEHIVEEVFKTLRIKYMHNSKGPDKGIDFAVWNDRLGRIIGNPIIIECKYGKLNQTRIDSSVAQLSIYSEKSDSAVAILLYLDKGGERFVIPPLLKPVIIAFDLEDFLDSLVFETFESLILTRRNLNAHKNS